MKKSTTMPDPARIEAWKQSFKESELRTVEGEIREELRHFGYVPLYGQGRGPAPILVREMLRHMMHRIRESVHRRVVGDRTA